MSPRWDLTSTGSRSRGAGSSRPVSSLRASARPALTTTTSCSTSLVIRLARKLRTSFCFFRGGENRGDGDAVPLGPSSETSRLRRVDKRLAGRAFPRIRGSLLQKLWTQSEEMDHVQRATRNLLRWIRNRESIFNE